MPIMRLIDVEEILNTISIKSQECLQLASNPKTTKAQKNFLIGRAEGYSDAIMIVADQAGLKRVDSVEEDENDKD